MRSTIYVLLVIPILLVPLYSTTLTERIKAITRAEMQAVVEFLAHDLLEGRAPGTRGGDLAELYVQSVFKFLDFRPGSPDGYLQPFTLQGFTTEKMDISVGNTPLVFGRDVMGTFTRPERDFSLAAESVFVGFGIQTNTWDWDDYKDVDVSGKIVISRVNDPGMFQADIFEGKILTYFGRWIYHIEEAARRGAVGILLIHTDASAGYGWNVVNNSWSGEGLYLPSDLENDLSFRAWIKESSLRRILSRYRIDLDGLYRMSLRRDFRPVSLPFRIRVTGQNRFLQVRNHNVVAQLSGKTKKRIVISAHIDHLGRGEGNGGDRIFNGALDNGTAVASMLVAAKILKEFEQDLHYSVTFLACNAEEALMLGSKFYALHTNRDEIIANINFESTPVWEKAASIMAIGGRFSTLEEMVQHVAKQQGVGYSNFSMSNQGFFYRSDQYSFARFGIPAIWISAGEDDASGENKYNRFWRERYHTVDDEYDSSWPLSAMRQSIGSALLLIEYLNKYKTVPVWKGLLTFPLETVSD